MGCRSRTEMLNIILQSEDPVEAFLNAYCQCLENRERAYNLLRSQRHEITYQTKAKEISELVRAGLPIGLLRDSIDRNDDDAILITSLALATALADHIATEWGSELSSYSQPFHNSAGDKFWLAIEGNGPFGGRIPAPPRSNHQLHWTLRRFREPLLVIPYEVGEWRLIRIPLDRNLEARLSKRLEAGHFSMAVSALSYDAEIKAEVLERSGSDASQEFYLKAIEPIEEQTNALITVLESASKDGVSILVLPELRMPPALLKATKEFLRKQTLDVARGLLLVAAGSWHIEDGDHRYNRSVVLNSNGEEFWIHDKLREYVITAENVRDRSTFFGSIGIEGNGASEAIHRGTALQFYDSVIGRVGVAICVGFFAPEVEPLLQASGVNVFLVPAMSPSMSALEARARALTHSQTAATFAANCGRVGKNGKARSFYHLPKKDEELHRLPVGEEMLIFRLR